MFNILEIIEPKECRFCLNDSDTFVCDSCKAVLRKNGITEIKNEGDYDWYRFNIDDFIQRKIREEICSNNI